MTDPHEQQAERGEWPEPTPIERIMRLEAENRELREMWSQSEDREMRLATKLDKHLREYEIFKQRVDVTMRTFLQVEMTVRNLVDSQLHQTHPRTAQEINAEIIARKDQSQEFASLVIRPMKVAGFKPGTQFWQGRLCELQGKSYRVMRNAQANQFGEVALYLIPVDISPDDYHPRQDND